MFWFSSSGFLSHQQQDSFSPELCTPCLGESCSRCDDLVVLAAHRAGIEEGKPGSSCDFSQHPARGFVFTSVGLPVVTKHLDLGNQGFTSVQITAEPGIFEPKLLRLLLCPFALHSFAICNLSVLCEGEIPPQRDSVVSLHIRFKLC